MIRIDFTALPGKAAFIDFQLKAILINFDVTITKRVKKTSVKFAQCVKVANYHSNCFAIFIDLPT